MIVRLKRDNQFGQNGPQAGDEGVAIILSETNEFEDEVMVGVLFNGREGIHWCSVNILGPIEEIYHVYPQTFA